MKKLHLDWQGYYPADEKTIRDKVEDRSGIFKISLKVPDGSLKPIFTAQAASVRMKLLENVTALNGSCIKEQMAKGGCQFRFAYLYTKEDLDAADRALYKRYTPKCNDPKAVPEVEDVEINHN